MKIGSVTLDKDMVWTDEFQFCAIAGTANYAIDGHLVVQTFPAPGGRPMTLAGDLERGWQKRDTVLALQALAEVVGATYEVELPSGSKYNVEFRVDEPPAVSFQPIAAASDPDADFWYYGTVNLRVV